MEAKRLKLSDVSLIFFPNLVEYETNNDTCIFRIFYDLAFVLKRTIKASLFNVTLKPILKMSFMKILTRATSDLM